MNKLTSVISALLILIHGNLFAQGQVTEEWSMRYNGPDNGIDLLSSIAIDIMGNVYITGRSGGIGTGQDYGTLKYSSSGQQMFELRYNASGSSWDEGNGIAVDHSGNIYVTGTSSALGILTIKYNEFGDTVWIANFNFPNGAEGFDIEVDSSYNVYVGGNVWNTGMGADIAIIKYSPEGNELWSTFIRGDSSFDNRFVDLEVDETGNIYVAGITTNQFFYDLFYNDFITVKLNTDGVEQWRQYYSVSDSSDDISIGLNIDHQGNIIIGGSSNGLYEWEDDYVVVKYSPSGTEKWFQIYESPSIDEDIPMGLVIDSRDNVVITGYSWRDSETFNFLTVKYDSSGNELWVSEFNGSGNKRDFAHAITLDSQDNIYVTGGSRQGILGDIECVTVKYDADGNQIWAVAYSDTESHSNIGKAIAVDDSGDVYIFAHSVGNSSGWDYLTIKYRQGVVGISDNEKIPRYYNLGQNYPNPFNPSTTINYTLPKPEHVQITIYDELGRLVRKLVDEYKTMGKHWVVWDGKNNNGNRVSSGIYFYVLKVGQNATMSKKMIMVK